MGVESWPNAGAGSPVGLHTPHCGFSNSWYWGLCFPEAFPRSVVGAISCDLWPNKPGQMRHFASVVMEELPPLFRNRPWISGSLFRNLGQCIIDLGQNTVKSRSVCKPGQIRSRTSRTEGLCGRPLLGRSLASPLGRTLTGKEKLQNALFANFLLKTAGFWNENLGVGFGHQPLTGSLKTSLFQERDQG